MVPSVTRLDSLLVVSLASKKAACMATSPSTANLVELFALLSSAGFASSFSLRLLNVLSLLCTYLTVVLPQECFSLTVCYGAI